MKRLARGQVGRAGGPLLRDRNKVLFANPEKWDGEAAGSVRDERMYSCTDHQGSVVALVGPGGALVEQARYSANGVPFGLPLGDVDADGDCDGADDTLHKAIETTGVYDVRGDLDLDGDVDSADWAIVAAGAGEVLGWGRLSHDSVVNQLSFHSTLWFHVGALADARVHVAVALHAPMAFRTATGRRQTALSMAIEHCGSEVDCDVNGTAVSACDNRESCRTIAEWTDLRPFSPAPMDLEDFLNPRAQRKCSMLPLMPNYPAPCDGEWPFTAPEQPAQSVGECLWNCMQSYAGVPALLACGFTAPIAPIPSAIPKPLHNPSPNMTPLSYCSYQLRECGYPISRQTSIVRTCSKLGGRIGGLAYVSCAYLLGLSASCWTICYFDPLSF